MQLHDAATLTADSDSVLEVLSERERLAITLSGFGNTCSQVAKQMGVTVEAVRAVFKKAFAKLGARNRNHAVAILFAGQTGGNSPRRATGSTGRPTERQLRVLELAADGMTLEAIGAVVKVDGHTVLREQKRLCATLRAVNTADAIRIAITTGLIKAWGDVRVCPTPVLVPQTTRRRQMLRLAAEGLTTREIARRLGITQRAVTFTTNAALEDLKASTLAHGVAIAIKSGLLDTVDVPADTEAVS